ncbi:MAG: cyclic nucleotide-binding domain-containing protein [Planctomycetes bacterium]|nr:cyclic nucleotide-binding domain-containing protein [Planctomycetota bacterium]
MTQSLTEITVTRPQRWDVPFGDAMRDADVDELLKIEPFASMDAERFPAAIPLRGILKNDTRVSSYQDGDIVVREGDYGSSAFLILSGTVSVVLEGLDPEALGRQSPEKQSVWQSLTRMWKNPRLPEVRSQFTSSSTLVASDRQPVADLAQTRVFLQDVPRALAGARSVTLHTGEIFGELSALTRTPRSATVLADGKVFLLEIRWQGLRDLMRRTDALRQHVEQLYRENSLRVHLRETPLLAQLPAQQLEAVAEATVFETHGNFEWHATFESPAVTPSQDAIVSEPLIVEEDSPSEGVLLVRSGFARLSHRYGHGHRTVAYLGKGQVFGLTEAIESYKAQQPTPMRNSLRALGYVDVIRIPQSVLEEHVFPAISESLLAEVAKKHAVQCSHHHCDVHDGPLGCEQGRVDPDLLEFLVERRFINGSQAMLIDLDRCTRCDDCVRACAATHDNNPRFIRHGHHHGSYMVANACMHCVDPVCMIGCPTGAIGRDQETGVARINDLTCIGCSTCANSCPYDNIRMAEIRDRSGAVIFDETSQQPIHKATKCDLCADLAGGPACQRACPHDALVRIDLGNLGKLSQWVNR